ncbi:glycosyltransferase family 39 protein [Clostridium rectalis]|uniref:glycosyltransferase family 39 protein n=1 Tax=Clostridium rectalis TaxID=2040295 RepID=UPI000F642BBD|nr:glycosyltransferase family 39 protein [Clostridium rectalis]
MLNSISHKKYDETNKKYYLILGLIGVLLSIIWITLVKTTPFSDFEYYYNLSSNIANGKPWGDTYTSVGYCIVLGFIFKIFGTSLIVAKIFNILLTIISYLLVYLILNKLDIGEKSKKVIYAFFVLFPLNIYYNSLVATEIFFTSIILLVTNIYLSEIKYKYLILGVLVGLNTIVKPTFICMSLAIFIVDSISSKKFFHSLKNSLIIFIVSILVITPWCYRNTKLIGQPTFVSNNGGIVLYINNNSQNNTGLWMPAEDVENSIVKTDEYINANMTKKNKMLSKAAKSWIKENPKQFIKLGFLRLKNTYAAAGDTYYTTFESGLNNSKNHILTTIATVAKIVAFYPGILFVLLYSLYVLYSLIRRNQENTDKFLLYCCIMFYMFTCIYFITEGQARYSFPLIFFMINCTVCFFAKIKEIFIW